MRRGIRDCRWALGIVFILTIVGIACSHPEKIIVDKYFMAVNQKDNQTLSSFAVVRFDKKVDQWVITEASTEVRSTASLPELVRKVKEAEAALSGNKKAYPYLLEHPDEMDQVRDLLKKGTKVPAKLTTASTEWEKFVQREKELRKTLSETKEGLEKEKKTVALSLGPRDDMEGLTGEMVDKELSLALTIGGQAQNYSMHLRKYDLTSDSGPQIISRWVIYGLVPKG